MFNKDQLETIKLALQDALLLDKDKMSPTQESAKKKVAKKRKYRKLLNFLNSSNAVKFIKSI